ncbi:DUF4185 domain-containing protein [Candidatus Saccharibacteria bacterium]|nr:DUF4185 domain-containing protein [Candidatus Saccharibacteria bacterium]
MIKKLLVSIALITIFASNSITCNATDAVIESTTVLGPVTNPSRSLSRDGGSSIKLGSKILWMFGDTLFNPASVDGTQLRSNTAALATTTSPYSLTEPLDANNAPYQFIPFDNTEQTYNDNASDKARDRYILWPNLAFNTSPTDGLVFYTRLKSTPDGPSGYIWSDDSLGAAEITADSTTASNRTDNIFADPDPIYKPILLKDNVAYFTHCTINFLEYDCALAKVSIGSILNRNSYEFWNGTAWVSDINSAAYSFRNLNGAVSWNEYLQKYVNIYKIGFGHSLRMTTADSLTGTWSNYTEIYDNVDQINTLYVHPELFTEYGRNMIITYTDLGGGGVEAIQISFQQTESPIDSTEIPGVPNSGILLQPPKLLLYIIGFICIISSVYLIRRHTSFDRRLKSKK